MLVSVFVHLGEWRSRLEQDKDKEEESFQGTGVSKKWTRC